MSEIDKIIRERKSSSPVVLVFVDESYFEIFKNWLLFQTSCQSAGEVELVLGALDEWAFKNGQLPGVTVFRVEWDKDLTTLWKSRVETVLSFLKVGRDVLHSDVDAIWLSDPFPYLIHNDHDLLFSQGTIWPQDVVIAAGIVVCCGFFYIRSNKSTVAFVEEWLAGMESDWDDQRVVNRLLLKKGMSFKTEIDYQLSNQGLPFNCFNNFRWNALAGGMRLGLLPHKDFQRMKEPTTPIVAHYMSPKQGDAVKEMMMNSNLWYMV